MIASCGPAVGNQTVTFSLWCQGESWRSELQVGSVWPRTIRLLEDHLAHTGYQCWGLRRRTASTQPHSEGHGWHFLREVISDHPFTIFLPGLVIIICYPPNSSKALLSTHAQKILHPLKKRMLWKRHLWRIRVLRNLKWLPKQKK